MKKSIVFTFLLSLVVVVGVNLSLVFSNFGPKVAYACGGVWAYVCCGALCPGGVDACIGTGNYTCCK